MKKMNSLIILALAFIFALPFAARAEAAGVITAARLLHEGGGTVETLEVEEVGGVPSAIKTLEFELHMTTSAEAKEFKIDFETVGFTADLSKVEADGIQKQDGTAPESFTPVAGIALSLEATADGFRVSFDDELEAGTYKIPLELTHNFLPGGNDIKVFSVNLKQLTCETEPQPQEFPEGYGVSFANHYSGVPGTASAAHHISLLFIITNGTPVTDKFATVAADETTVLPLGGMVMKFYFQGIEKNGEKLDVTKFKMKDNLLQYRNHMAIGETQMVISEYDENWRPRTKIIPEAETSARADEVWYASYEVEALDPAIDNGTMGKANYVVNIKLRDIPGFKLYKGQFLLAGLRLYYDNEKPFIVLDESYSHIDLDDVEEINRLEITSAHQGYANYPKVSLEDASGNIEAGGDPSNPPPPPGTNTYPLAPGTGIDLFSQAIEDMSDTGATAMRQNPVPISVDISEDLMGLDTLHKLRIEIRNTDNPGGDKIYAWLNGGDEADAGGLLASLDASGVKGSVDSAADAYVINLINKNPSYKEHDINNTDTSTLPDVNSDFYRKLNFLIYSDWLLTETSSLNTLEITVIPTIYVDESYQDEDEWIVQYVHKDLPPFKISDGVTVVNFKQVQ